MQKELTKQDSKMTKGLAIILMVSLHLFCRKTDLPYECLKIAGVPLVYYLGLFGEQCVSIYCFCSGYAHYITAERYSSFKDYYKKMLKKLLNFFINYWIIVVLFSLVGLVFDKSGAIPGSLTDFLLTLVCLNSYNGAWWFVLTYAFLVIFSRPIYKAVTKAPPLVTILLSLLIYIVAFAIRFYNKLDLSNYRILEWLYTQFGLFGTSVFPYITAMLFAKFKLISKLREFKDRHFSDTGFTAAAFLVMAVIMVGWSLFQNVVFAPFVSFVTIPLFNTIKKSRFFIKFFDFFGTHSTNIWFTHMFFYSTLFKDFAFIGKYPLFIFIILMACSIFSSYIILIIHKNLVRLLKLDK